MGELRGVINERDVVDEKELIETIKGREREEGNHLAPGVKPSLPCQMSTPPCTFSSREEKQEIA